MLFRIKQPLNTTQFKEVENFVSNAEDSQWVIRETQNFRVPEENHHYFIEGYFYSNDGAIDSWRILSQNIANLPRDPKIQILEDQDWKETYKQHYHAWNVGSIHWVPEWQKSTYQKPDNEPALYLDPGMAFGMCDHPTTRMCLLNLVNFRDEWQATYREKTIIDVGCGSGIIILSAAMLGFKKLFAFDHDPVAIEISKKNRQKNTIDQQIEFAVSDIRDALVARKADAIFANILSSVQCRSASLLLTTLNLSGYLVLSGLLKCEVESVRRHFESIAATQSVAVTTVVENINEWYTIRIKKLA